MVSYRMGLDVGTNSLGWSVLELNEAGEPCAVRDAGTRIFNDGRVEKSKATLKADRRAARSARRRHDRYIQRRDFLLDELTEAGLFPESLEERHKLQKRDPLQLRAKALTEKLEQHEIGRALFHLNQRRGFKSNRKDRSKETTSGKVSNSVTALLREMGLMEKGYSAEAFNDLSKEDKKAAKEEERQQKIDAFKKLRQQNTVTFGSFLWQRRERGLPTRARQNSDSKLYDVYPTRDMLEHEFNAIWTAQAKRHPQLLTAQRREQIRTVIFTQRLLKPQKVGKCVYLRGEDRTFRAMPTFQRYRIYQEVNNLEWTTSRSRHSLIDYREARDKITYMLERPTNKKGHVTFTTMKGVLRSNGLADHNVQFNFESRKRDHFDGNHTSNLMQDERRVGKQWHEWPLEKQDDFISVILNDELDDNAVQKLLMQNYGLSHSAAEACTEAPLQDGTAALSRKAARLLLAKMKDAMLNQTSAVQDVAKEDTNFVNPFKRAGEGKVLDRLPYYGETFQDGRHIIPGSHEEDDKGDDLKYFGGVTNPTVHIALNQIRHVVNELIARYGHPVSIAIELGRELPTGQEGRAAINKEQEANQNNNERLDGILREQRQACTSENRLRLRLWEELDADPNGRCCPFSGQKIGCADLFNGTAEIEHLIPFSVSLDNSRANKVICTRQANRDKDNRTPYQAFWNSLPNYNWDDIFERAKQLPKSKQWRFQKNALDIWYWDHADFTERHLNDTRYISRLAKEYLGNICPFNKIDVLTGRLTALLRSHWGLNNVLHDHNGQEKKKNRNDHRHHAVDAIVIGMTSRSMLQKVSTAAACAEERHLGRLFERKSNGKSQIDPWDGFRGNVRSVLDDMIVSHRPKRKPLEKKTTDGQLHNDTAYGIILGPDNQDRYKVVVRYPITEFKDRKHVAAIRDKHLRHEFLQAFEKESAKGVVDLAKTKKIRSLRRTENLRIIPIKDKSGKVYKAYKGDSNWGMEIYEYPKGHEKAGEWEGIVISRYEANQKDFQPGQTRKRHPAARLVMRLHINDCVAIEKDGHTQIMRLQKLSQNGRLTFAPHYEANVDARNRDQQESFKYLEKTDNALKGINARKVHVSPAGRVSYESRRKPSRKNK